MENDFKEQLAKNVNKDYKDDKNLDLGQSIQKAEQDFKHELKKANEGNPSPITDLKTSKGKLAELRREIDEILKEKYIKDNSSPITDLKISKEKLAELRKEIDEILEENEKNEIKLEEKEDAEIDAKDDKEEEQLPEKEDSSVMKGYLDRLEILHNLKMEMYDEQIKKNEICPNEDLFYKTIFLERELMAQREKLSQQEQDGLLEIEEKYKKEEMVKQKKIRDQLKIEARNFDKLVTALKEVNDEIKYVQKLQLQSTERDTGMITEEDAEKRLIIANEKRTKILAEISIINPDLILEKKEQQHQMEQVKRDVMGGEINPEDYSEETQKNIKYANATDKKTEYTFKSNDNYYKKEIEESIISYKEQFEKLKKRLNELPNEPETADDIKEKANILVQMRQVKGQITQTDELIKSMEDNMAHKTNDTREFEKIKKEGSAKLGETNKGFKETKEYVGIIEKEEVMQSFAHPLNTNEANKDKVIKDEAMVSAMIGYVMEDEEKETPPAGCALIPPSLIINVNKLTEAGPYLEAVGNIEKIQKEREEAKQELEGVESEMRN